MRTLGVDLSAQPKHTAACVIRWRGGQGTVATVRTGLSDEVICSLARESDRLGLDVPLGWPDQFVEAVSAHRDGIARHLPPDQQLRFRETDRAVHMRVGRWPLSVSTDRIGVTAFRAVRLAGILREENRAVDRDGSGDLVEVYPAAALHCWGLPSMGYKGPDGQTRREGILTAIAGQAGDWLQMPEHVRDLLVDDDHALDAFVASLVVRAHALGLVEPIPEGALERAAREGWIALPLSGSLEQLAGSIPKTMGR